jgi:DNA-directed RNA polymerase specialized sigma subunit
MPQRTIQDIDLSTLSTVGRGIKLTQEVINQLHKAFEMKASNVSIANAFNINKATVVRYKKKYNLSLLTPTNKNTDEANITNTDRLKNGLSRAF